MPRTANADRDASKIYVVATHFRRNYCTCCEVIIYVPVFLEYLIDRGSPSQFSLRRPNELGDVNAFDN